VTSRWVAAEVPPAAATIAAAGYPRRLAELLALRGIAEPAAATAFLSPTLEQLHPPELLLGVGPAVELLDAACARGAPVAVVGDYDVDGVSATALLVAVLRASGARPIPILGRRHEEGYGFHPVHVLEAVERRAELLVTVDCGTNSHEAIAEAGSKGIPVIVTDHHLPEGDPPRDLVLINPRQEGCSYPDRELTGAGLALKLAVALLRRRDRPVPWEPLLRVACLGTIADVAPLVGENRIIAALGLEALGRARSPGLRALLRSASVRPPIRAADVGFRLGPRLNAAGRLGSAEPALELLLARDERAAAELAERLEASNRERQTEEARVLSQARDRLAREPGRRIAVLWSETWNRGVVGIAASRLARELARPVVLLAVEGARAVGSGRSVPGIHLHDFLGRWSGRLDRFGGHAAAIGLTARPEELPALAEEWGRAADEWPAEALERVERYDLEIEASEVGEELLAAVERLEPTGPGNEAPRFRLGSLRALGELRTFGRGHLSLRLASAPGEDPVELVAWGWADRQEPLSDEFEALVRLERDPRTSRPRLVLADARAPSAAPH